MKPVSVSLYTKHCYDFVCEHNNAGFRREVVCFSWHGTGRVFHNMDML